MPTPPNATPPLRPSLRRRDALRLGLSASLAALTGCHANRPPTTTARFPPPDADPNAASTSVLHPDTAPPTPPPQGWPLPNLADDQVLRYDAGIRPFRRGSVRLEVSTPGQFTPQQTWIHNYGHGGSGWTLAPGCAQWTADRADERLAAQPQARTARPPIAVLGGGIVGLSAAHALAQRGHAVTLYAHQLAINTTSAKAGAQFAPSLIDFEPAPGDPTTLHSLVRASHRHYTQQLHQNVGVTPRINYTTERGGYALRGIPTDLSRPFDLEQLPLAGLHVPGRAYHTLHIDPPLYLPDLQQRLAQQGVRFAKRRFEQLAEVAALPERLIVNCLGLGAGSLLNDDRIVPLRGQLIHLKPQPKLRYMISHRGYMFPRRDTVVFGGTVERGQTDPTPNPHDCQDILQRHRQFFGHTVKPRPNVNAPG